MEQAMQTVATRGTSVAERTAQRRRALNMAQLHLQRFEDGLHQRRNEIEQDLGLVSRLNTARMSPTSRRCPVTIR